MATIYEFDMVILWSNFLMTWVIQEHYHLISIVEESVEKLWMVLDLDLQVAWLLFCWSSVSCDPCRLVTGFPL